MRLMRNVGFGSFASYWRPVVFFRSAPNSEHAALHRTAMGQELDPNEKTPLGANDTTRAHVLQTDQKDYGANDAV